MGFYQGRALQSPTARPRTRGRKLRRLAQVLGVAGLVAVLAHLPWDDLRGRIAVLTEVRVEGFRYLDAPSVASIAGLKVGQDLFTIDCKRARQALLLHPRIERAEVSRCWPRGVKVRIVERVPILLVRHGQPWELDSSGVLLPPLADGVVSDVPLLAGISFEHVPAGAALARPEVRRGLEWVRAMSASEIQLVGRVSEVDVSDLRSTRLILMDGTRVFAPALPPDLQTLSALRVVLADLERHGTLAQEVDVRFKNQVIVRPALIPGVEAATAASEPETTGGIRSVHLNAFSDAGR